MTPVRWGVLGVSGMVGRRAVLPALAASPTADLAAIASRSPERARAEAERFGAPRWYGEYAALLRDPEVEAVYIPLPTALHLPWVLAAAAAGKHVLCEKPLGCTAEEAHRMAQACARAGVLLVEAYMTPFHPVSERISRLVTDGTLGSLIAARAAFTFPHRVPTDHRWLAPGGGALLDVGIYCLEPMIDAFGRLDPVRLAATAGMSAGGVDTSFGGWLDLGAGRTAALTVSFDAPEMQVLELVGQQATLTVERAFTPGREPVVISLRHRDGDTDRLDVPGADPYLGMVEHVARAVRGLEAPRRPVARSIAVLELIDRLRAAAHDAAAGDAGRG